jgi:CYTH domain-containing protein
MPIEHEKKFCILKSKAVESLFAENAEQVIEIEQKYLLIEKGLSIRVRISTQGGMHSYRFTTKVDVNGQTVEIETPISEDDYERLWSRGQNKVKKTRYIYRGWEVDFFKSGHINYFAVAEIELPAWQKEPEVIPTLISDHLIYVVPPEDKRFSNKKLGDVQYATDLLATVKAGWQPKVRHIEDYKVYKRKFK